MWAGLIAENLAIQGTSFDLFVYLMTEFLRRRHVSCWPFVETHEPVCVFGIGYFGNSCTVPRLAMVGTRFRANKGR